MAGQWFPSQRAATGGGDAPDAAALFVAPWVAEIDLTMVDDRVCPVGDIDGAVWSHGQGDRAKGGVFRAGDVRLDLGDVAGFLFCGIRVYAQVIETKSDNAVSAEIIGEGMSLPFRTKKRTVDDFEPAKFRIRTGADAVDRASRAF